MSVYIQLSTNVYVIMVDEFCCVYNYCIAQNFDVGNIDRLASFRSLTGKILTDSLLENLYLLYS